MAPKATTKSSKPSNSRPKASSDMTSTTRRTELVQISNILLLTYHRNKNQHRRSRWWKELSVLRRGLRRLLAEGEDGAGGDGKKGVRKGVVIKEDRGMFEKRVAFLRVRIVPRCWVAFSAVVADNQYAALGLMLIGTLGRLGRVLGLDAEAGEVIQAVDVAAENLGEEEEMGRQQRESLHAVEDLGVPLQREEVMRTGEEGSEGEKKGVRSESEVVMVESRAMMAKKKRTKKHHDAIDNLFSGLV